MMCLEKFITHIFSSYLSFHFWKFKSSIKTLCLVAHGCIYAMVQLFDNDGQLLEAASSTFSHNNEIG